MGAIIILCVVLAVIVLSIAASWRYTRSRSHDGLRRDDERDLAARLRQLAPTVCDAAALFGHPGAAEVERWLCAGSHHRALAAAEVLFAAEPNSGQVSLILCRALLYCGQIAAARSQLVRARESGANKEVCDYFEGRLSYQEHEANLRASESEEPASSLMSNTEILLVRIKNAGQGELPSILLQNSDANTAPERIKDLVTQHFAIYRDALELCLCAAEPSLAWIEPAYHAARLACKLGLPEGVELMKRLAPAIDSSPDHFSFQRELGELTGVSQKAPTLEFFA